MRQSDELDDPRRRILIRALAAGVLAAGSTPALLQAGRLTGRVPREIPRGKSIYELKGVARVNGMRANLDTVIGAGDLVETGDKSRMIFVVGKDAFILRSNSRLQLIGKRTVLHTLRLVTGKLLSVFGRREHTIRTVVATIGIRGTGIYVESFPEESYVCTCYGISDIVSNTDPTSKETIESEHHDAPRYVVAGEAQGKHIRKAPFKNHTDLELMLIEALVGRTPPFKFIDQDYGSPRKSPGGIY